MEHPHTIVQKHLPGATVLFMNERAALVEHRGGLKWVQTNGDVTTIVPESPEGTDMHYPPRG